MSGCPAQVHPSAPWAPWASWARRYWPPPLTMIAVHAPAPDALTRLPFARSRVAQRPMSCRRPNGGLLLLACLLTQQCGTGRLKE
ncbi:unnamed protein product [Periconia digitata]|uniref:Uncharacterized protein n=1 Tax=Periconia digitata TaxID=1303443 RepID=A0A9W4XPG7_9PLEO|nr:unnamed protein product [Periconia digitata]